MQMHYRHCTLTIRSKVYVTAGVRPSFCPICRSLQQLAAGLLLSARLARDIDRLLAGAGRSANAGSATPTAGVGS